MSLRARLFGIKSPHIIRTIHRDTLLNASELKNLLPKKNLQAMFPRGAGLNFDFMHKDRIILRPEEKIIATINGELMQIGQEYHLLAGDIKELIIGEKMFRLDVLYSNF